MSKIGRKPVDISGVSVNIQGQEVHYKGVKSAGLHLLPEPLIANVQDKKLFIVVDAQASISPKQLRDVNRIWGLHHALLENKIKGSVKEFEKKMKITGLGFKATVGSENSLKDIEKKGEKVIVVGNKNTPLTKGLVFDLGYSHYYYFKLPQEITVDIDKTGQNLVIKGTDPVRVGLVASEIRQLRKPEVYKGTGIKEENEIIRRKAGKTKAG